MSTTKPRTMMGMEAPGDQIVPIKAREWQGMKLAAWRAKVALEIIERAAAESLPKCRHVDGCPGATDSTAPCVKDAYETVADIETEPQPPFDPTLGADYRDLRTSFGVKSARLISSGCPDRELRMSLLVILNAARSFAPINARRPAGEPYFAPSREYFSEVMAELGALQLTADAMSAALLAAGIAPPEPSPAREPAQLPQEST